MAVNELDGFQLYNAVKVMAVAHPEIPDHAKYVGKCGLIEKITKSSRSATVVFSGGLAKRDCLLANLKKLDDQ